MIPTKQRNRSNIVFYATNLKRLTEKWRKHVVWVPGQLWDI